MQKSKLQFKIQNYLVAVLIFVAVPVLAAEIHIDSKSREVGVGEQFEVNLFVNTQGESVNAFEGKITFPSDLLKVKEIRDGNSIINFWIDKPKTESGTITFSGITPGGFQGNNGLLFSAVFEAESEGAARFEINDARVLRNDGTGSQAVLTISPLEMKISSEVPIKTPAIEKIKDTEPPESFAPEIAADPTLFDGKWFLVFATQDKGSGIDHYTIKESRQKILNIFKKWTTAESPYVLTDQELRSYVFVKAVDKAGNVRIEKIAPQNPLRWYENYENWLIIMIMIAAAFAVAAFRWNKRRKELNAHL